MAPEPMAPGMPRPSLIVGTHGIAHSLRTHSIDSPALFARHEPRNVPGDRLLRRPDGFARGAVGAHVGEARPNGAGERFKHFGRRGGGRLERGRLGDGGGDEFPANRFRQPHRRCCGAIANGAAASDGIAPWTHAESTASTSTANEKSASGNERRHWRAKNRMPNIPSKQSKSAGQTPNQPRKRPKASAAAVRHPRSRPTSWASVAADCNSTSP